MTRALLICLLLFSSNTLVAQHNDAADAAAAMVAAPDKVAYKLDEPEFEAAYGFNDTAQAVIRLYYSKWKWGKRAMSMPGFTVPVVTTLGRHYATGPYGIPDYSRYYYDSWVAPVVSFQMGVLTFGIVKATKWNRRHLYEAVRQYRITRQLPPQVKAAELVKYF